ncbi:efflux RND transporter permease subunit [Lusitaniella coriacea LEGE 07157]|uniref:Efflux RND transporter permease subunit n=1 Tax=Lusitaniella coriacea LEGE 07157 TaxID=945747 RepID=A0A8J7IRQ2_9CYAN|nr:efflux RND transporter permease subunit [Lusitaniella coriacea]MBE9115772.1 efflux RND transporter permease subunit [Lusitaniella coriacea LEGE 07157]
MNGFSLSSLAIRRHIGTLALTVAALVLGVFFLTQIQVDLLPSITYPRIGLRLSAPGVSPEVAVEEITKPLEEAFSATEGVTQIYSQTREGRVSVDLFFEPGEDVDRALNDATASFNRVRGRLPDSVEEPRLFKFDPSQLPVYEFALRSDSLKEVALRVFADEELARELGVVSGVASVDVSGGVTEEVRVQIDPTRLQALGLGLTDVLDELRDRNIDLSGGRLSGGDEEPLTRTVGKFQTAEELRNLEFEIPGEPSRQVYLRDFAEIIDGTAEQRIFVSLNGEPAVKVSLQKQPNANTVAVVSGIKQKLSQLRDSGVVSEDITLQTTLDESIFIRNAITNVALAGVTGSVLAALVVFIFLGSLRQTLIVVIAIPLATLTAIALMKVFGLSLNVFSLGGLALGVGIVVDNGIVMLETIADGAGMTSKGMDKPSRDLEFVLRETERSSRTIESALLASTSTNLVAVLPFLLIGGFFSLLFNELILTISFAVTASLLIALTVVPMLASRLFSIPYSSGINRWWVLRQFNEQFQAATRTYQGALFWVLRHRLVILAIAIIVLGGGSWWLGGQLPQEILPRINTGQARLFAQFSPGTTLAQNRQVMAAADEILLAQPETESSFTTSGGFLFGNSTSLNVLRGSSTIILKPGSDVEGYIDRATKEFGQLNLVKTRLRMRPGSVRGIILTNSPIRGAEIDVTLQGNQTAILQQAGEQVLEALDERVTLANFRPDADSQQPEVQILPDWERAAEFGLSVEEIGEAIQTAIEGNVTTQLQRRDRLVDIRVELPNATVENSAQLAQLPLLVGDGRSIRLQDVARIDIGQAPGEIQRINQREVFLIAGSLNEEAILSDAIAQTNTILAQIDLPEGVSLIPSSAQETNQKLQNSLKLLGGLAAFLVFIVMAVQYNSLIDPLVIIFAVPLALAGGILGLYLTQTAIGATVLVGAILLVGIVVNNAIVMVELANQIHSQYGISRRRAILKAAPQRLRPILMTTITTVLGLFPLALGIGEGSEFLQPLGIVVFSGLSFATLLTLFIIPCFYTLLHETFRGKQNPEIPHSPPAIPTKSKSLG